MGMKLKIVNVCGPYSARSPSWRTMPTSPAIATPSNKLSGSSRAAERYSSGLAKLCSHRTSYLTRGMAAPLHHNLVRGRKMPISNYENPPQKHSMWILNYCASIINYNTQSQTVRRGRFLIPVKSPQEKGEIFRGWKSSLFQFRFFRTCVPTC